MSPGLLLLTVAGARSFCVLAQAGGTVRAAAPAQIRLMTPALQVGPPSLPLAAPPGLQGSVPSLPRPDLPSTLPAVSPAQPVVRSALPESRAWALPDGGPILGRFLNPEGSDFGGRRYIDLMNPTALRLASSDGRGRVFIWVRAVRAGYKTQVAEDGSIRVQDYLSDTLLFELKDGKPAFIERALESEPEKNILLEDARVSSYRVKGRDPKTGRFRAEQQMLLGMTVHARHGGMAAPSSRNGFARLFFDAGGVPRIERDADFRPVIALLSPEPFVRDGPKDHSAVVDAKNGLIMTNAKGELRLHSRHRYQAEDPRLPDGFTPAPYAEQSFPLPAGFPASQPDWPALMSRLAEHETLRSDRLEEHYAAAKGDPGALKGLGPGAQPVRIRRRGGRLFVSEGWGFPWVEAGALPRPARAHLKNGRSYFLGFDHEIRTLRMGGKTKRVYTLSVKLWDPSLDKVLAYGADLVQPSRPWETENPGIPDLWHVYPTGRVLNQDGTVDTWEGAADANVVRRRWSLPTLLAELRAHPLPK